MLKSIIEAKKVKEVLDGYHMEEFDIEDVSSPARFSDSHIVYNVNSPYGYVGLVFNVRKEAIEAERSGNVEEMNKYDSFAERYDLDQAVDAYIYR